MRLVRRHRPARTRLAGSVCFSHADRFVNDFRCTVALTLIKEGITPDLCTDRPPPEPPAATNEEDTL